MNNRETTIFNILLSFLILTILAIYIIITKTTPARAPIAKVNNIMIYSDDLKLYLYSIFGNNFNNTISNIPDDQLEDIIREYMIDYNILKDAKKHHTEDNSELKKIIHANYNKLVKDFYLDEISEKLVNEDLINLEYVKIKDEYLNGNNAKYEYKIKHILVSSKTKAQNIYNDLDNIYFENAAQIYSLDKSSGKNGGDLGYLRTGTMVSEFEDIIPNLKVGEVSEPFKTDFGWHLIKLDRKKIIPAPPLSELRQDIINELKAEAINNYIGNINESLNIKIVRKENI